MNHPFRLKHKRTGLYYIPLRLVRAPNHDGWVKSNLSKTGKVYFTDPRKHIGSVDDHTRAYVNGRGQLESWRESATEDTFQIELIELD